MLAFAGCGGDDEEAQTTPRAPELTVPQTDTAETVETQTAPETTTSPPAPEPDGSGGVPPPEPQPAPDSPESDQPPPPGSPAERFEEFCEENPGACG
jgi:hypothetical protein